MNETNVVPTLNVDAVYKKIESFKTTYKNKLTIKTLGKAEGHDIIRIDLNSTNPDAKKIVITAGMHGNEAFGVTTALEVLESLVHNQQMRSEFEIVFFPMLNPAGLKDTTRLTRAGQDLNHMLQATEKVPPAIKLFKESVKDEEFVLALDLHGARLKEGFYFIRVGQDESLDQAAELASKAIKVLDPELLFQSPTGVYPAQVASSYNPTKPVYTVYAPGESYSNNKGTVKDFFHQSMNVQYSYTLEYPGLISTYLRQENFVKLVHSFIEELGQRLLH